MTSQQTEPTPAPRTTIADARCVFITGATSGLGRALALAVADLPSHPTVIAAGRRKDRLDAMAKVPGVEPIFFELAKSPGELKEAVDDLLARFPELDTIILNAGIQHQIELKNEAAEVVIAKVHEEMAVNYTAVVALITYILPHFLKRSAEGRPSSIVTVTSGLGIVPAPLMPNYSATKAALRSFTTSLRVQLMDTNVHVMEIIPPLVESELHDAYGTTEKLSKFWMPLDEFTNATMEGLKTGAAYIPVGRAAQVYERFEEGKDKLIMELRRRS